MAEIIKMPRLSDTMTEGVIAAWHKKVGDPVQNGDLLAEVETDKATMDVESFFDGVLLHIGVAEGDGIPVGQLLAIIGKKGEDVSELVANFQADAPAEEEAPAKEEKPAPVAEPVAAPVVEAAPTPKVEPVVTTTSSDSRIKASPLAKAMAKDKGIDLALVAGSGDNGRIVKKDIENFKAPAVSADAPAEIPAHFLSPAVAGQEEYEEVKVSQMRKTIARRLSESKFTAPHFYLTMEINMDRAVESRKAINEVAPVKISYNDIVI
ncbi:MAG: E3 binding domain-containing protein, partial [Bacteroidetes bacterium]|nr:E3 binding domain-containing protein [Bacteroidota bacterium]